MSGPSGPGRHPPLLAARSSGHSVGNNDNDDSNSSQPPEPERPMGTRPKRTLIESACSACRRRKSRCDGMRPHCSRCQTLRTECTYEAEEGESRWSALRRRNQILETERTEMRELMSYVQSCPEHEAHDIFNRIRSAGPDDVFNLLRHIRQDEYSSSPDPYARPPSLRQQQSSSQSSGAAYPASPAFVTHHSSSSSNGPDQPRLPPIQNMFAVSERTRPPPPLTLPIVPTMASTQEPGSARSHGSGSRGSQSSMDHPMISAPP